MKNSLLFACIAMLTAIQSINAQLAINVSGGLNYSNVDLKNVNWFETEAKPGYFVAVEPSFRLTRRITLGADIQYSRKGFDFKNIGSSEKISYDIDYVDIIPQLELRVFRNLALGLGASYGVKINENYDKQSLKEQFQTVSKQDFGVIGKLKYSIKNFFAVASYNFGVSNISRVQYTNSDGEFIKDTDMYNRNFQLGVGYKINL